MIKGVVEEGTGTRMKRIYGVTAEMGGKTGTTNNNSDGWFMAFTPSLVSATWVGGEEPSIHFDNMAHGQGASMALPIYGEYITKVYGDSELEYTQDETFELDENFDPCAGQNPYRNYEGAPSGNQPAYIDEGIFD